MSNKWLGLQFKCSLCGKLFAVGNGGFKVMKARVMKHAQEHFDAGKIQFEIVPVQVDKAIGMRWQCQICKVIFRLNQGDGMDGLRQRVGEHAGTHLRQGARASDIQILPIG